MIITLYPPSMYAPQAQFMPHSDKYLTRALRAYIACRGAAHIAYREAVYIARSDATYIARLLKNREASFLTASEFMRPQAQFFRFILQKALTFTKE